MILALKTGFGSLAAPRFCPMQRAAASLARRKPSSVRREPESGLGLSCGQSSASGISYYIYE